MRREGWGPKQLTTVTNLTADMTEEQSRYHHYSVEFHDNAWRYDAWKQTSGMSWEWLGDPSRFSPGRAPNFWHYLTSVASFSSLATMYIVAEILLVVTFAVLFLAAGEGELSMTKFTTGIIVSARTTTALQTLSFDEQADDRAATLLNLAVGLLVCAEGWVHFLLATVASALVVARACRPLQQLAWAQRCTLQRDLLTLRLRILRPDIVLVQPSIHATVSMAGRQFPVEFVAQPPMWAHNKLGVMNVRARDLSALFIYQHVQCCLDRGVYRNFSNASRARIRYRCSLGPWGLRCES